MPQSVNPTLHAIDRYGGILLRPRVTASALDPAEGAHDGLVLGLAYVLAAEVVPVAEGLASVLAGFNFGGIAMLASALGRALLPPILTLILCEALLGSDRAHRRGVCLMPLVVVAAAARALTGLGVELPGPGLAVTVLGAALSAGLALWVRDSVVPEPNLTKEVG